MLTEPFVRCFANRQDIEPNFKQPDVCLLESGHTESHQWWDRYTLDSSYTPLLKIGDSFILRRDWGWLKDDIEYTVENIGPGIPDGSPMYFFSKNGVMLGDVYADLVDDEIREGFAEALKE